MAWRRQAARGSSVPRGAPIYDNSYIHRPGVQLEGNAEASRLNDRLADLLIDRQLDDGSFFEPAEHLLAMSEVLMRPP